MPSKEQYQYQFLIEGRPAPIRHAVQGMVCIARARWFAFVQDLKIAVKGKAGRLDYSDRVIAERGRNW